MSPVAVAPLYPLRVGVGPISFSRKATSPSSAFCQVGKWATASPEFCDPEALGGIQDVIDRRHRLVEFLENHYSGSATVSPELRDPKPAVCMMLLRRALEATAAFPHVPDFPGVLVARPRLREGIDEEPCHSHGSDRQAERTG
jgi:hypothetical protein